MHKGDHHYHQFIKIIRNIRSSYIKLYELLVWNRTLQSHTRLNLSIYENGEIGTGSKVFQDNLAYRFQIIVHKLFSIRTDPGPYPIYPKNSWDVHCSLYEKAVIDYTYINLDCLMVVQTTINSSRNLMLRVHKLKAPPTNTSYSMCLKILH